MARFNEILVGRYNRFLQKLLSMKGAASLVTLSDEMMAVWPFFHGVENRYLEGWDVFGAAVGQVAVVGQTNAIRWRNPVGSNVLIVIEALWVGGNTGGTNSFNLFSGGGITTDLATLLPVTASRLDARSRPNPTLSISSAAPIPGSPPNQFQSVTPFNQLNLINTENQEMPLLPGDAMQCNAAVLNVANAIALKWRERFLEDSERA